MPHSSAEDISPLVQIMHRETERGDAVVMSLVEGVTPMAGVEIKMSEVPCRTNGDFVAQGMEQYGILSAHRVRAHFGITEAIVLEHHEAARKDLVTQVWSAGGPIGPQQSVFVLEVLEMVGQQAGLRTFGEHLVELQPDSIRVIDVVVVPLTDDRAGRGIQRRVAQGPQGEARPFFVNETYVLETEIGRVAFKPETGPQLAVADHDELAVRVGLGGKAPNGSLGESHTIAGHHETTDRQWLALARPVRFLAGTVLTKGLRRLVRQGQNHRVDEPGAVKAGLAQQIVRSAPVEHVSHGGIVRGGALIDPPQPSVEAER